MTEPASLRNDGAPPVPTSGTPWRLLGFTTDADSTEHCDDYSDLEQDAHYVLDRLCPEPRRGQELNTYASDMLIRLLDADPLAFADYARRFIADQAIKYAPKPKRVSKRVLKPPGG